MEVTTEKKQLDVTYHIVIQLDKVIDLTNDPALRIENVNDSFGIFWCGRTDSKSLEITI